MPLLMRALGGNRSRIGGKLIRCEASLPLARDARLCPHQGSLLWAPSGQALIDE